MRKSLLIGGLAVAAAVAAGAYFLHRPQGNADGPVTLFQWEDYTSDVYLADYQKAYGEKPQTAIYADEDEAFAKMRAGFKPDVMGPCYYEYERWREAGLLKPIDTTKLTNWNKISATLRTLPGIDAHLAIRPPCLPVAMILIRRVHRRLDEPFAGLYFIAQSVPEVPVTHMRFRR